MANELEKEVAELLSEAHDALEKLNMFCDDNATALMAAESGPLFCLMIGADQAEWIKLRDRLELRTVEYRNVLKGDEKR